MLPIPTGNHFYREADVRDVLRADKLKSFVKLHCETPILVPADSADSDSDSSCDEDYL